MDKPRHKIGGSTLAKMCSAMLISLMFVLFYAAMKDGFESESRVDSERLTGKDHHVTDVLPAREDVFVSPKAAMRERSQSSQRDSGQGSSSLDKEFLSQDEVEALRIPSLSARTHGMSEKYIEYAELSEEEVLFLREAIDELIDDIKSIEITKAEALQGSAKKLEVFIPAFPEEGHILEGEFRYALRERLGRRQEDFFMKLNKPFFTNWIGDFGRTEQLVSLDFSEQGIYKYQLATIVPVSDFKPKALAHEIRNRMRSRKTFREKHLHERFSHVFIID